jgi:hypothetical protein
LTLSLALSYGCYFAAEAEAETLHLPLLLSYGYYFAAEVEAEAETVLSYRPCPICVTNTTSPLLLQ